MQYMVQQNSNKLNTVLYIAFWNIWTLTCFHVALIIFVWASVHHKNDGATDRVVCEPFIQEKKFVPTALTNDCGAG
jgi:hypothetical protein